MSDPIDDLPPQIRDHVRLILDRQVAGGEERYKTGDSSGRIGQKAISRLMQDAGVLKNDPRWKAANDYGRWLYSGKPIQTPNKGRSVAVLDGSLEDPITEVVRRVLPMAGRKRSAVTARHRKVIASMAKPEFRELVSRHETALGDRLTIYFRPTSNGLMRIALHPSAPKYLGFHAKQGDCTDRHKTDAPIPSIEELKVHLRSFEAWLPTLSKSSDEERGVISWLRRALTNQLWLSELGEGWAFLHQEWRFVDGTGVAKKPDVLAVHLATGQLGIVEFKSKASMLKEAGAQVDAYGQLWARDAAELAPLFTDLTRALGVAYGNELAAKATVTASPAALFVGTASPGTAICVTRHRQQTTAMAVVEPSVLGPQAAGDSMFTARMRLHQSWYRANVLRAPFGTGPTKARRTLYGNMLAEASALSGKNFLSSEIYGLAKRRIAEGGGVEEFRCLRNMLSSQPLCFNLFGPLALDLELATRCFKAILPGVERVTEVRIEYAPAPNCEYLSDRTSFDAFVGYRRVGGGTAFLAIETKLTEPFSQKKADITQTTRYLEHTRKSPGVWSEAACELVSDQRWYQLWRNHLLARAVLSHRNCTYDAGRVLVAYHPRDEDCARAIAGYRRLLLDPDSSFVEAPFDRLMDAWEGCAMTDGEHSWLKGFRARYLSLELSAAWVEPLKQVVT